MLVMSMKCILHTQRVHCKQINPSVRLKKTCSSSLEEWCFYPGRNFKWRFRFIWFTSWHFNIAERDMTGCQMIYQIYLLNRCSWLSWLSQFTQFTHILQSRFPSFLRANTPLHQRQIRSVLYGNHPGTHQGWHARRVGRCSYLSRLMTHRSHMKQAETSDVSGLMG